MMTAAVTAGQNRSMDAPRRVAAAMRHVDAWWAIAGGWAIDLWLDRETRHHHDVEIVIRRDQQALVHAALSSQSELFCLDPPGSGWQGWSGTAIEPPSFQLQARSASIEFDLFTETVEGSTWTFRRDPQITRPVAQIVFCTGSGLPVVRPEVQLLYMAKSSQPKHAHDFDVVRPTLDEEARVWLATSLVATLPSHPWLARL
jgi:hypothetical protein